MSVFPIGDYRAEHPSTAHLIIEVADSSLSYDRGRKVALYAECGVPDYWVVNLVEHTVEVHRAPTAGKYSELRGAGAGEHVALLQFPDVKIAVDDLFR